MLESQTQACPRDHTAHDLWNLLETLHSSGMLLGEQDDRKQAAENRRWRYQTFQDREALEREEGRGHLRWHAAFESAPNVEMELFEDTDGRRWKSSQCGDRLPCHQHARPLHGPGGQLIYPENEQRDVDSKHRIYPH